MHMHCTTTLITDPFIQITTRHISLKRADPTAVLRSFLPSHKLAKAVIIFITASCSRGLGCESISDCAGHATNNTDGFYEDILSHIGAFKGMGNPSKKLTTSRA